LKKLSAVGRNDQKSHVAIDCDRKGREKKKTKRRKIEKPIKRRGTSKRPSREAQADQGMKQLSSSTTRKGKKDTR